MSVDQLIFAGLNSKIVALDRDSGERVWEWSQPGAWNSNFVSLLLDGDRLVVAVNGYLYCLDARSGAILWENQLRGCGHGMATLTSLRGQTLPGLVAAAAGKLALDAQTHAALTATRGS